MHCAASPEPATPRCVSAARAALHALAAAALPEAGAPGPVPPADLLQLVAQGRLPAAAGAGAAALTRGLWATLAVALHVHREVCAFEASRVVTGDGSPMETMAELRPLRSGGRFPSPAACLAELRRLGYCRPALFGWGAGGGSAGGTAGGASGASGAADARELLLAVGWVAADCDALAVARELAWARRPARLLPPWPADTAHGLEAPRAAAVETAAVSHGGGGGASGLPPLKQLHSVHAASQALILGYGQLRGALRALHGSEATRAKQLRAMDEEQARHWGRHSASAAAGVAGESATTVLQRGGAHRMDQPTANRSNHNDGTTDTAAAISAAGSSATPAPRRGLSCYELHLALDADRCSAHCEALAKATSLGERLRQAAELEPAFWAWLAAAAAAADAAADAAARAGSSAGPGAGDAEDAAWPARAKAVAAQRRLQRELAARRPGLDALVRAWEREVGTGGGGGGLGGAPRDGGSSSHAARCDGDSALASARTGVLVRAAAAVDEELAPFARHLPPPPAHLERQQAGQQPPPPPPSLPPSGAARAAAARRRCAEALRTSAEVERRHAGILAQSLALCEPHFPAGVQPVHFATAGKRRAGRAPPDPQPPP